MATKKHVSEEDPNGKLSAWAKRWAAEAAALRERLVFLCMDLAPARGRYAYLETRTAIAASKWKNVFLCRQMPTVEMLIAIAHYKGAYVLWLMTGSTEPLGRALAQGMEGVSPASGEAERPLFEEAPSAEEWAKFTAHRAWVREEKAGGDKED